MMLLIYVDGLHGINYHRLITPLRRLEDDIQMYWIDSLNKLSELDLDKVDYLIVSRKISVGDYGIFRKILDKYNIKLVLDNDDYWELEKHNQANELYFRYLAHDIKNTIKIADIIWSPSHVLIKEMKRINPRAEYHYIPNSINPDDPQWQVGKLHTDKVRFGYLGAMGHSKDIDLIGYDFSDKEMYSVTVEDYPDRFGANYVISPEDSFSYGKLYKYFDVSLVPLGTSKFNQCKSDLKISEAGFTRTAVIASNVTPYKQVVEDGVTGILVSDKLEWKDAIEGMTLEKATRLANNLYDFCVEEYHVDKVNEIRLDSLLNP
jgi:glycosyltransferase involved in cell wall biosynthesis